MLAQTNVMDTLDMGGGGFVYALEQAHLPGLIVSAVLLGLSVVSWSVMFSKFGVVGKASRQNYRFMYAYRKAKSIMAPYEANVSVPGSPLFAVYRAACRELVFHMFGSTDTQVSPNRVQEVKLNRDQMESVRAAMDRAVGETILQLESRMTFLATAVSGAPFLGLLGTVWGVMETFSGVAAAEGAASLQSMAPGVSAALVTTVIALLVAIPAMFGYNFIVNRIRTIVLEMNNYAAELSAQFERRYVEFHPAPAYGRHPAASTGAPPPPQQATTPDTLPSMSAMGRPVADEEIYFGDEQAFGPSHDPDDDDDGPPINPIANQSRRR